MTLNFLPLLFKTMVCDSIGPIFFAHLDFKQYFPPYSVGDGAL